VIDAATHDTRPLTLLSVAAVISGRMNEHDEVRMLDSERNSPLAALNKGREALTQAVEGVDEDLAARKPAVGGWSILECVNHIVESERYLLSRLHIAQQSNESFADGEREAKIAARAANRARKIEAPSESQPRNRYATLREALAAFDTTRDETIQFLEAFGGDLRRWTTDHPLFPGPVTCQETLIMIAAHPCRHAEQILEIRSTLEGRVTC
jgi:uncharacterized damage-inducible protein DinB